VGCRGTIVEFHSFFRRRERAWVGFTGRHQSVFAEQVVAVGQTDVGVGVIGIVNDGLGEGIHGLVQTLRRPLVPIEAAF
jgi:hypothetical protein